MWDTCIQRIAKKPAVIFFPELILTPFPKLHFLLHKEHEKFCKIFAQFLENTYAQLLVIHQLCYTLYGIFQTLILY